MANHNTYTEKSMFGITIKYFFLRLLPHSLTRLVFSCYHGHLFIVLSIFHALSFTFFRLFTMLPSSKRVCASANFSIITSWWQRLCVEGVSFSLCSFDSVSVCVYAAVCLCMEAVFFYSIYSTEPKSELNIYFSRYIAFPWIKLFEYTQRFWNSLKFRA